MIYVERQNFIGTASQTNRQRNATKEGVMPTDAGSSYAWSKYSDSESDNLVPMEIALRIVYAIEHDERFAAYLVIPLHPERPGPQRSLILLYTWHTIAMMYRLAPNFTSLTASNKADHQQILCEFSVVCQCLHA